MNAVDLLHLVAKAFFAILRLFFLPNVPVYHRIFLCVFTICTTFPYKHWQLFEGVPCCFLLSLMTLFGVYDNVFLNESLLLDREKIWSSFWINILYKLYSSLFFFLSNLSVLSKMDHIPQLFQQQYFFGSPSSSLLVLFCCWFLSDHLFACALYCIALSVMSLNVL